MGGAGRTPRSWPPNTTAIEDRIQTLRAPLCSHMPEGDEMDEYVEQWERQQYEISVLTNILNGDNQ